MQSSVNQIASAYRGNPAPLQQRVNQDRQANQGIPADLKELLALQILTEERDSMSRQQAIQQLQETAKQPTVAQSLQQRAQQAIQARSVQDQRQQQGIQSLMQQLNSGAVPENTPQPRRQPQGIDQLPANMDKFSGGGIVAFEEGGSVVDKYRRESEEMGAGNRVKYSPEVQAYVKQMRDAERSGQDEYARRERERMLQRSREIAPDQATARNPNITSEVMRRVGPMTAPKYEDPRIPKGPAETDLPAAPLRAPLSTMAPMLPKPAAPVISAEKPVISAAPAAGGLGDLISSDVRSTRQKMMVDAMSRDPDAAERMLRERYEKEVGAPQTAGLEQLAQELKDRRAQMQERNKNIDPLVERLSAIASAPRGQKWMYSLLAGNAAVDKAQQAREAQDFEMLKQIVEQQNKIEDVKRGYRTETFAIGVKERDRVYKDAFDAAKELGADDRAAQQLAQEAVLRREQMAASEKISQRSAARENQSIAMNNEYRLKMVQARKLQDEGDVAGAAKLMAEANDILMLKGGAGSASVGSERNDISRKRLQIQTWEKIRDSSADPKAIEEAEQKIVQLARDIDKMESGGGAAKIMTQADVLATAKSSGKTPQQVIEAAKARGYTIQ